MSPASVSNFVGDLVAMATAFERLPQVEADLADARNTINAHLNTIQRLQHKLLDRANELTDAQSRIRSLEVERDDAQFHALEADDRTQRALDFIKTTFGNAGSLIQALEPPAAPKPEPATSDVPVSAVPATTPEAPVTSPPINSPEPDAKMADIISGYPYGEAPAPEVAPTPGEPDANSMEVGSASSMSTPAQAASAPDTASSTTEPSLAPDASFSMRPVDKPYAGKTWTQARSEGLDPPYDKDGWLDGGGTIDNYYA